MTDKQPLPVAAYQGHDQITALQPGSISHRLRILGDDPAGPGFHRLSVSPRLEHDAAFSFNSIGHVQRHRLKQLVRIAGEGLERVGRFGSAAMRVLKGLMRKQIWSLWVSEPIRGVEGNQVPISGQIVARTGP